MECTRISSKDLRIYFRALQVAKRSNCNDKHGTIITRGGAVIASSANRFIGHRISTKWLKKTLHSEQRALLLVGEQSEGAVLYTARLNENNLKSMPCNMCMALCL